MSNTTSFHDAMASTGHSLRSSSVQPSPPPCRSPPPASIMRGGDDALSVVSALSSPPTVARARGSPLSAFVEIMEETADEVITEMEETATSFVIQSMKEVHMDSSGGNGDDSDEEGDEFMIHQEGIGCDVGEEEEETPVEYEDGRGHTKALVELTSRGSSTVIGNVIMEDDGHSVVDVTGDDVMDVKIPAPPADWKAPLVQQVREEPNFEEIDNPGNWPRYCFRPSFLGTSRSRSSKYKCHSLPTGAIPVPKNADGKRVMGDWTFHYDGWSNPDKPYRRGATTNNMFPNEMDGCLDADVLKKYGLTKPKMVACDALFFYQLILPLCNPTYSGIEKDERTSYYVEAERCTNMSKYETGMGGSYGHQWTATTAKELANFDGILVMDGVLGSSDGALHRRWEIGGSCYNESIAKTMTLTRFGQLKRSFKLCHNNSEKKRGEEGYNPAYKYDLIYKAMVNNTKVITKYADENQTVDETTWGHAGYGEAGSGLTGRLMNKKVNKGGQTTIMSDSRRFRPRAYIHRHKLHDRLNTTRWGCTELKHMLIDIEQQVVDPRNNNNGQKQIFKTKPTICADNFFFDDKMNDWIGENGFSSIGTQARNCLPAGVEKKYLHIEKHPAGCKYSKVARFTQPIIAVKDGQGYQRVHVSFQSTSSANISTVNCLNECKLFVEIRERGKGENKRCWGIEMNDARRLYLSTYFRIDVTDHLLMNAAIFYRVWKYWHAPKNHCLALVIVLAYDLYIECCEGKIELGWKIEKPVDYHTFREKLAKQLLSYSPLNHKYPGDEKMRANTSKPRAKRAASKTTGEITLRQIKKAKTRYSTSRLCGDLGKLCLHVGSKQTVKKPLVCYWCGSNTYIVCTKCRDQKGKPIPLHYNAKSGPGKGAQCFYDFHNDSHFGLGKNDTSLLLGKKKADWTPPDRNVVSMNQSHVRSLLDEADL